MRRALPIGALLFANRHGDLSAPIGVAQARNVRHSIRDLAQGACLPFQALGKVPDRMPATKRVLTR